YFDEGDVVRHRLVQRIIRGYDEFKTRVAEEQAVLLESRSGANGKPAVSDSLPQEKTATYPAQAESKE
ncbi:MAG: hypothetical protein DMG86_15275, partial [Acidobacteria bacterium]